MKFWPKGFYGFSLIELLIVIVIMTFLVAIAMSGYKRYVYKSRTSEAKAHLSDGYVSMKTFFADRLSYTTRLDAIGFNPEGPLHYRLGFTRDQDPGNIGLGTRRCYDTIVGGRKKGTCQHTPMWTSEVTATSVKGKFQGGYAKRSSFSMGASAILKGSDVDSWSIDENKILTNDKRGF